MQLTILGISTRRSLCAGVVLVLAGALLPSVEPAASVETRRRVVLGAENTFTASTTSGIRVRVPASAAYVGGADSDDIRIEGGGRMAGWLLVQEGVPILERVVVMTSHSRFCGVPGCTDGEPLFWHTTHNVHKDRATKVQTLTEGDYILYVIADETPVTVTLRLAGLTGTRRITLTRPADAGIRIPRVHATLEPTKSVYSFGEEVDYSGPSGIAIELMRFRTGRSFANRRETCSYVDGPKVPSPLAYAPGCPAADFQLAVSELSQQDDKVIDDGYFLQATGGHRWGFGMNYVVAGDVREAQSLFFYVDVDPREL